MKISKITNGLLVSLLLSASVVEADSKYPATDFQPKVVYQDSDYKHSGSSTSSSKKSTGEVSSPDSNYPAANFQPEVLYQDKGYKHSKGNVTTASSTGSVSNSVDEQQSTDTDAGDSSLNLIIGLAILAFAGYVFYSKSVKSSAPARKKAPARKASSQAAVASSDDSVSGVAKYLESKGGSEPSGVAKYLNDRESAPVSSVAKYVAKKKVSARLASVTGVEKYLKDRG
ncbi:MAG: hypothetical protein ACKE51_06305 [Methylococcaceae bacterium]